MKYTGGQSDPYDNLNPYISLADIFMNVMMVLLVFIIAVLYTFSIKAGEAEGTGGTSEVYLQEQRNLALAINAALGNEAPTRIERNDPGGAQRYFFPGSQLFGPTGIDVTPHGKELLLQFANVLTDPKYMRSYRRIRIEGNSSPVRGIGKDRNRWHESVEMAFAVGAFLLEKGNIPAHLMIISGRGGQAPLDKTLDVNGTPNPKYRPGDSKHVRVEIVIEYSERSANGSLTKENR